MTCRFAATLLVSLEYWSNPDIWLAHPVVSLGLVVAIVAAEQVLAGLAVWRGPEY